MRKFFKSLFSSEKGTLSSKRVFGGLGFMVCIFIAIFSVVSNRTVPAFCSELLYTCAALLGIDSVASAFYKSGDSSSKSSRYKYNDYEEDEYEEKRFNKDDKEEDY